MKARMSRAMVWYLKLNYVYRLAIAVGVAVVAWLAQPADWSVEVRLLVSWGCYAASFLIMAWVAIIKSDPAITREHNDSQDTGRYLLFLLIVSAAIASLAAIGFLSTGAHTLPMATRLWHLALSLSTLLLSWLLIQTLFGFHYAHRYYGGHHETRLQRHGLKFPGDRDPDYLDFAYYSFVVGMTSQVSDVAIATRPMRRLTLIHGVLSFWFNVAILAMSINVIGDTLK